MSIKSLALSALLGLLVAPFITGCTTSKIDDSLVAEDSYSSTHSNANSNGDGERRRTSATSTDINGDEDRNNTANTGTNSVGSSNNPPPADTNSNGSGSGNNPTDTNSNGNGNSSFDNSYCNTETLESVNVKSDFAAAGDGITDDADAFYDAIMTGKKVIVPAGIYILSQINLPDASTIILCGAGKGITTLRQKASQVNTAMITSYGYSSPVDVDYMEIQNMTIDGNYPNVARREPGDRNYGTIHVMVREMLVANCEFTQAYHALKILAVHEKADGTPGKAVIRDNWFHDMALEAPFYGGTTHAIYVAKNVPAQSTIWILRNNMEACGSGTGESCTLPSTTPGQSVVGILYSPDGPNPPQQELIIKDNIFRNLGHNMAPIKEHTAAVYLYQQADKSKIIGNHFYNPYYKALAVFSSNNVEIAHNTVEGCGVFVNPNTGWNHVDYYAIAVHSRKTNFPTYVSSSGYDIHNNLIKNTSCFKHGISAAFEVDKLGNGTATDVSIRENVFINNINPYANTPMNPIDTMNTPGVVISGNDDSDN